VSNVFAFTSVGFAVTVTICAILVDGTTSALSFHAVRMFFALLLHLIFMLVWAR
jgi:hypothetical protein